MKFETLLTDVEKLIKTREYVEIDPITFSGAIKTTFQRLWDTDPSAVRPKAREMAAARGLHFQTYMYPDNGRTSILFSRLGSPISHMTQKVRS